LPVLIIDNYDSFTWNLADIVASVTGEMPHVVPNDGSIEGIAFSHIIISPGPGRPDNPRDFGVSAHLIRTAQVPLLGVCLGHQGIAHAFGCSIRQGEPAHGVTCQIVHSGDELFEGIPSPFTATRYHSLHAAEPLPPELRPIARSTAGDLMAFRHLSRPLWGVQFHPESILTEHGSRLVGNFLGCSRRPARTEYFRERYSDAEYAFWLEGWRGRTLMGTGRPAPLGHAGPVAGFLSYEGKEHFLSVTDLEILPPEQPLGSLPEVSLPQNIRWATSRAEYLDQIRQCLQWIRAGESYELCLTNQLLLESDLPALDYFERLRRLNPAPYAAYMRHGDIEIACASPECFLHIDASGYVETRPIKGTLPCGADPAELVRNPRFRAENLMITDLLRNDLSRVCAPGTVHVPRLMEVETHPTVHQLVSTIAGRLRPNASHIDCIHAAFPGGSMTGAPKKRSMELLARLEQRPRGVYSGCLGYIDLDGETELNIVIRTAVFHQGAVTIGSGGAIVAQSDPAAEWEEMELKTSALLRAFGIE
jgi:para-aminobenzoate synthetase